ncbi:hypothetical protein BV22DRAFT_1032579 [Leucogyrophana mollusca]|uniref:Uncharacterized protein n=1 Tax=Leucogyrophana mollusca TaxID=85980 RepID=A0ACB8BPB9_9AGAM|nr:hypothetical protein BV22DRAFT_1032579 [Leucogyrophana mollusca]
MVSCISRVSVVLLVLAPSAMGAVLSTRPPLPSDIPHPHGNLWKNKVHESLSTGQVGGDNVGSGLHGLDEATTLSGALWKSNVHQEVSPK